jgi:hypothetical protein
VAILLAMDANGLRKEMADIITKSDNKLKSN